MIKRCIGNSKALHKKEAVVMINETASFLCGSFKCVLNTYKDKITDNKR